MTCRPPGALADEISQGITLFQPVTTSLRLIEACSVLASALGVNVSVSASHVPFTRGKAATTDEPANASDGEASELLSSVEIFVQLAAACASGGDPPIANAASSHTDLDRRIPSPLCLGHCAPVRPASRATRCCRACAPSRRPAAPP